MERKLYSATLLVRLVTVERSDTFLRPLRVKQIVRSEGDIEQISRLYPIGIVIVVLGSGRGKRE